MPETAETLERFKHTVEIPEDVEMGSITAEVRLVNWALPEQTFFAYTYLSDKEGKYVIGTSGQFKKTPEEASEQAETYLMNYVGNIPEFNEYRKAQPYYDV